MTIGLFLKKKKINEYINKYKMLQTGDGVVLGLSGGPDSVCLFFVLLELRQEYDLNIVAVHVNHMIRGKDADEDQEYVENLCKTYNIPIRSVNIDIPKLAEISGRSLEEEARLARYEQFEHVANEMENQGCDRVRIAIAHNANDNAETVLFHMARGCGLDGVCGIAPVRGRIIRPLLQVSKTDIIELLDDNQIDYCIDATNAETDYDRNRIRHNIMPEMCQVNDRALEHISELTARLTQVSDYLNIEAEGLLQIAKSDKGLRKRAIATAPPVIASQALKLYISRFMPQEKDVSSAHIESILGLLDEDGERQVDLPYQKTLVISYEDLYLLDNNTLDEDKGAFSTREFKYEQAMKYPTDSYTKWFDCDRISENVVIRNRRKGDFITINADGGTKSIQDYFVDAKVPRHLRESIPLVCDGSHVMWIVGYRISEYYKITDNTTRVLEICYTEE